MGTIRRDRLRRLLADAHRAIAFDHPRLSAIIRDGKVIVEGVMSITPSTEEFASVGAIASYEIRIEFPLSYPTTEPKVFELGKAFPHNADYHCNSGGDCCICVFETWRAKVSEVSVAAYVNGPVRNFFLSQFIKRETGAWPFDEWQHGRQGYLDACADRLGCRSKFNEVDYLLRVLSHPWPRGHWHCPCGSSNPIRSCCAGPLRALAQEVNSQEARAMRKRLRTFFPETQN